MLTKTRMQIFSVLYNTEVSEFLGKKTYLLNHIWAWQPTKQINLAKSKVESTSHAMI